MKKIEGKFFVTIILFLFGIYISYNRGSNFSDGDAYSVINAYLSFFEGDIYKPSRGAYGHPIPEFLIGIISYNFGTKISNIFCFTLFFLSIIFLYKAFLNNKENIFIFIILVLSNSYLLLENTNSIDYPIALFFLSLAFYSLKSNKYYLSYIFFGMTIACRANFLTFVYPILVIYFFLEIKEKKFKNFILGCTVTTLVGLIFYYPLFNLHNYSLDFLDVPFIKESDDRVGWYGGPSLEFSSLFPRFVYKIYLICGIFSIFLILIYFNNLVKKVNFKSNDNIILSLIIFINLFVFYFMPTKILIINPFIITLYIIIFKHLDKKKIYFLIIFNFSQWFVFYNIADIKYKKQDICYAKEAIDYTFRLSVKRGTIIEYFTNTEDMRECYGSHMGVYYKSFIEGKPLKLSR